MSWALGDIDRRMQGLVRIGVVTAVDASAARARVSLGGEAVSAWLPWLAERAATISVWAPVSVGEQVLVLAPGGDTAQGVIVGSLFSAARAAPSTDAAEHRLQLGDASISVRDGAIEISAGGTVVTIGGGGMGVNATVSVSGGNVTTTGNVAASGNVTATGAVAAGGISLGSHTHQAPSGGGTTTPPNQT